MTDDYYDRPLDSAIRLTISRRKIKLNCLKLCTH